MLRLCLILGILKVSLIVSEEVMNSTELSVIGETSTQLRAKRQWGGNCGFYGCGDRNSCGPNGCNSGCIGYGCGGYGGSCAAGCGSMCCNNPRPRPCVNCGAQYRCCPCCMPRCTRSCVRNGGCYCDYDYGAWGRKRRHALEFDRSNSTEIVDFD